MERLLSFSVLTRPLPTLLRLRPLSLAQACQLHQSKFYS